MLSPVRLSVTFVRLTQRVEIFDNFSSPFATLAMTFTENVTQIVSVEPLSRGV